MSNMNTNRQHAKAKARQSGGKQEIAPNYKKLQQEEFGAEFDFAQGSKHGKVGPQQPVSERTAWH